MLLREGRSDEGLVRKLFGWRHSGCSMHNEVRITAQDGEGRQALAEHILRSPFVQEKMRYHPRSGTVISRSKLHPVLKGNFEVFPVLDWLAPLTAHIPNPGEHVVRYYGRYSTVSRGKRRKTEGEAPVAAEPVEVPSMEVKREWAHLTKQVYEVDPLVCPRCGGGIRILAFIERAEVIEKILTHLGLWLPRSHGPPRARAAAKPDEWFPATLLPPSGGGAPGSAASRPPQVSSTSRSPPTAQFLLDSSARTTPSSRYRDGPRGVPRASPVARTRSHESKFA
jgi:hypothetical protein